MIGADVSCQDPDEPTHPGELQPARHRLPPSVVSRTDWYWNLLVSSLLLDENMVEAHSQGLRGELAKINTQLYTKLLLNCTTASPCCQQATETEDAALIKRRRIHSGW